MKKYLALILAALMVFALVACGETASDTPSVPETPSSDENPSSGEESGDIPYIAVISKGEQHQFWQTVKKGADAAAAEFNVKITFEGPATESDIAPQVEMIKAAIAKEPAAIALAALSTDSAIDLLNECKDKGIPIVGFDSGIPNAPEGTIYTTASTNNEAAAALAAQRLFANEDFKAKFEAATAADPVIVGVLSQDATSSSIVGRTNGFLDKMDELAGGIAVTGHDVFNKENADAKVKVVVQIPADTTALKDGAEMLLKTDNITAIFASNEGAVEGLLAATDSGKDFNKEDGKYKDIIAIGFDAGKNQKNAIKEGWFYGSITQDPYQIGYLAVKLAVDAINGKPAANELEDTGAQWYNKDNIDEPMINDLVYD